MQIVIMDHLDLRVRSTGNDLYRIMPVPYIVRYFKQPVVQKQIFFCRIIPVQYEPHRQRCDRRALYATMCIAPISEFLIQSDIFTPDIKPSDKSDSAVDHYDFTMIPIIDTQLKISKQRRKEFRDLDSCPFQTLPIPVLHRTASHTVK